MKLSEVEHDLHHRSMIAFTDHYYEPAQGFEVSYIIGCLLSILLIGPLAGTRTAYAEESTASDMSITFRLVESDGKPVRGAFVGTHAAWGDNEARARRPRLIGVRYGARPSRARATDEKGEGTIAAEQLFRPNRAVDEAVSIFAVHEEKKLAGLTKVTQKDRGKVVEILMQKACRVKGHLLSKGLAQLGQSLAWTNVYVYWDDSRPFSCSSEYQRFEFLLPPGRYQIGPYGTGTREIRQELVIKGDQQDMELEIDLPPDIIAALKDKQAPELQEIKGWKNGAAVKLRDLRDKVVLLDFWGFWCVPCLAEMPKLMELHEKYADKGLVIIGVHDDSIGSIFELENKLLSVRDTEWSGRDIPFLIALDGGGDTPVKGMNQTARGATTAAYGIEVSPTTVLIDKRGRVVGRFDVNSAVDIRKLEVLLGLAEDSAEATSGSYALDPTVYRLQEDEVLKYIGVDEARVQTRPNFGPDFDGTFYFASFRWIDGEGVREDGPIFQQVLLEEVLRRVVGLSKFEYQGSEELLSTRVDGDWIVRHSAPKREKMQALGRILRNELKLPIRITHRVEEKDVIVARGRFKFQPLSGTNDDSKIHVYGESLNLEGRGFHSSGNLQELLDRVAERIVGKPIVTLVEASEANEYIYVWLFHWPSSLVDGLSPEEKEKTVRLVLDNLSKHTSLAFSQERYPVDVWYVTSADSKSNE